MAIDQKILTGGCQCGALRYELQAAPLEVYICHCSECRRQSSSAFGISVIATAASLRLVKGEAKGWSRPIAGDGWLDGYFCADCGSRLWHQERGDDVVSVKGGSLDDPIDIGDVPHIWTKSKLPGMIIPDHVDQFPRERE